jgi:cobalt-zinc-cadmium efflux system outer membrane protein
VNANTLTALINRRADVQALKFESQASRRDATLAARRAIPDLSVRVGYARDNLTIAGDQANTLSVSVSLPLPIFDHGQHDKSRSLSRALELDQTRRALTTTALADLEGLVAKKSALERTLTVLESETLPRSASVLESAQKAFDQGQFSLTDLLIARRSDIALRLSHSDARFELFAVRSELRQVLGLDENSAYSKE